MIIGLSGKARAGKDTFGNLLIESFELLGIKAVRVAFADVLKDQISDLFDMTNEQLYGNLKEVEDTRYPKADGGFFSPREVLQNYGQFMRTIDSNYWVNRAMKKVATFDKDIITIITDVRHTNEVDMVKSNGLHIRILREGASSAQNAAHISETALDSGYKIDDIIENNSSLEELKTKALALATKIINLKG